MTFVLNSIESWQRQLWKHTFIKKGGKKCLRVQAVHQTRLLLQVLIFCVEFRELSHLTRDLCQAEKKITVVISWATDKITTIFTQNDNFDHFERNRCDFVPLLSLYQHLFPSKLEISHVLNGTTPEIQHRKCGLSELSTSNCETLNRYSSTNDLDSSFLKYEKQTSSQVRYHIYFLFKT